MNRFPRSFRMVSALSAAALAVGASIALSSAAAAQPTDAPRSGDDRATAYPSNATGKDCPTLFPGSEEVPSSALTFDTDADGGELKTLNITAVADGYDVAGVVVKGGNAHNVYLADGLGELPWEGLASPLVSSGKPAAISHWFACGVRDVTTSTVPTTPTVPTSPTATGTSTPPPTVTNPGMTDVPPESTSTVSPTTTTPAPAPVAEEDDLASTGFNGGWLIALAAVLLLGGGAMLTVSRLRHSRNQ